MTPPQLAPSTTWTWKRVRVRAGAPPAGAAGAAGAHRRPLARRNRREPLTVSVSFRGGAECWWEIKARGQTWRRPGALALHDVLSELYEGHTA